MNLCHETVALSSRSLYAPTIRRWSFRSFLCLRGGAPQPACFVHVQTFMRVHQMVVKSIVILILFSNQCQVIWHLHHFREEEVICVLYEFIRLIISEFPAGGSDATDAYLMIQTCGSIFKPFFLSRVSCSERNLSNSPMTLSGH